jgi:hypothetical protein
VNLAPGELDPATVERIRSGDELTSEIHAYERWSRDVAAPSPTQDYLFEQPVLRFEARADDVLIADPTLRVESRDGAALLVSERTSATLALPGVSAVSARRLLGACDGSVTLRALRARHMLEAAAVDALIQHAFGKMLFAPLALSALERALSGLEITRFPGSPYEIGRTYWDNMAAVRRALDGLESELASTEGFAARLRELHVLALMGRDLHSYYKPRSPISERRAAPGQLMETPTRWHGDPERATFVSGPRVNASLIGGRSYHELLYASLDEPEALHVREHTEEGLSWGRLLHGRAEGDAESQDWFCPPRPVAPAHFETLRRALSAALAAGDRREELLPALARAHQAFIRLHPFHCGNQSLIMNVINWMLGRTLGSGIPHLMLDHLALRLSSCAYVRVFARAVAAYANPGADLAQRYFALAQKRTKAFALLGSISACTDMDAAYGRVAAAGDDARLLLLLPLAGERVTAAGDSG